MKTIRFIIIMIVGVLVFPVAMIYKALRHIGYSFKVIYYYAKEGRK